MRASGATVPHLTGCIAVVNSRIIFEFMHARMKSVLFAAQGSKESLWARGVRIIVQGVKYRNNLNPVVPAKRPQSGMALEALTAGVAAQVR